jgi:hypothetical protein
VGKQRTTWNLEYLAGSSGAGSTIALLAFISDTGRNLNNQFAKCRINNSRTSGHRGYGTPLNHIPSTVQQHAINCWNKIGMTNRRMGLLQATLGPSTVP